MFICLQFYNSNYNFIKNMCIINSIKLKLYVYKDVNNIIIKGFINIISLGFLYKCFLLYY